MTSKRILQAIGLTTLALIGAIAFNTVSVGPKRTLRHTRQNVCK
jgi:hypothetical protein